MTAKEKLDAAKAALTDEITCAVFTDRLYLSKEKGVRPWLLWLTENDGLARGMNAAAADRIIGRAAALLMIYAGVTSVYGEVMSEGARKLFADNHVAVEYGTLTASIMNRSGDDLCPMEMLTAEITSPEEAYKALRAKIKLS